MYRVINLYSSSVTYHEIVHEIIYHLQCVQGNMRFYLSNNLEAYLSNSYFHLP